MKWIELVMLYGPAVLKLVQAVEEIAKPLAIPGQVKKQMVMSILTQVPSAKEIVPLPSEHISTVGEIISATVNSLNSAGIFTKGN